MNTTRRCFREDKAAYVQVEQAVVAGCDDRRRNQRFPRPVRGGRGIAISEGAQLAREIADITIAQDNLYGLVTLKEIVGAVW